MRHILQKGHGYVMELEGNYGERCDSIKSYNILQKHVREIGRMRLLTSSGKGRSKIVIDEEMKKVIDSAYDETLNNGTELVGDAFYLVIAKGKVHFYPEPVELFGFVYARKGTQIEIEPVISIPKTDPKAATIEGDGK